MKRIPWYLILWRIPWLALAIVLGALFLTVIYIGYGPETAEILWADMKKW